MSTGNNRPLRMGRSKRIFLYGAIALLTGTLISSGIYYFQHHQSRFLREAEARLDIDDRDGAIGAFRSHMLEYSQDYAVLVRLAEVLAETGQIESAKRTYRRIINGGDYQNDKESIWDAAGGLKALIDEEYDSLTTEVQRLVKDSLFGSALTLCEATASLTLQYPFFPPKENYIRNQLVKDRSFFSGNHYRLEATQKYNDNVIQEAYITWLSGGTLTNVMEVCRDASINFVLSDTFVVDRLSLKPYAGRRRFDKDRALFVADLIYGFGGQCFSSKNWRQGVSVYQFGRDLRLLALDQLWDEWVGNLQYNVAICAYNQESYRKAISALNLLKAQMPEYEKDKVSELIKSARNFSSLNRCWDIYDKGSKRFEEESWISAISSYDEAAKCFLNSGTPDSDDRILECRANMAMAYSNNGQYSKAKYLLLELQRTNPNFNQLWMTNQIERLNKVVGSSGS